MINKKGFTLVELIVVIAVMGVILILALPQVGKIQSANKTKKYEAYQKSIESAAKLYVDSHAKDLFGTNNSGCVTIEFSKLQTSNLVKDFGEDDITCDDDSKTYVEVRKVNDNYKYDTAITCEDTNKVVYQKTIDHTTSTCENTPDDEEPIVVANPDKHEGVDRKDLALKINISDDSGLANNIGIIYYWTDTSGNKVGDEYQYNYHNKKDVENISFQIPTENIPKTTGEYQLVVKPWYAETTNAIKDVLGNEKTGQEVFGPYKIDNEPPACPSLTPTTPENTWTNQRITFTFGFTEDTAKYEWYTDSNGDWKLWGEKSPTETQQYITGEGKRKIKLIVFDDAGNSRECFSDNSYWIDKTAPSVPTVNLYNWKSNSSENPTSSSGLSKYTSGTWTKLKVFTQPSSSTDSLSGVDHYEFTTTGTTTNLTNHTQSYRNIEAEGKSTIKWRACDKAGNCSNYSSVASINQDRTPPTRTTIVKDGANVSTCKEKVGSYSHYYSWYVEDTLSGMGRRQYDWATGSADGTNYGYTKILECLGTYIDTINELKLRYKVCDAVGNCIEQNW